MTKLSGPHSLRPGSQGTSLLAGLTTEEQLLAATLSSPAVWGEAFLFNRDGQPRKYRPYQVADLECDAPRVVHMDGRAVGKTVDLATLVLWFAFTHPGKSVLVAAPYQGHLDTIIEEVEHQLDASEALHDSVARNAKGFPKIRRKPYFEIEFTNGVMVYFRPGGTGGAAVPEAPRLERRWTCRGASVGAGGEEDFPETPSSYR